MCGVVALFDPSGPIPERALDQAIASLHHRGPDGNGKWVSPDGRVGLGHTRLSIIDLATGAQPIGNEDGSIQIVVNGEFYDFERIRRGLIERGHRFKTGSDSEILVKLYEEHGTSCVHRLRGEFAFILWDARNGMLFAGRDRLGIKPLVYARVGSALYFASEAKALFAAGVPAAWDRESFYQWTQLSTDQDRTLFQGVYQVPPGHFLTATRGGSRLVPYWDLDFPRMPPPRNEAEQIELVRHELSEAIRLRLRADVPVGCFLSGGIDSGTVLAIAASHRSDPIDAYTIRFGVESFDEDQVAREMADHVGARFHCVDISRDMMIDAFGDSVWHSEYLSLNEHGAALYLLNRKVHEAGLKVMLTGHGGDEMFGGYAHLVRDMMAAAHYHDNALSVHDVANVQYQNLHARASHEEHAESRTAERVLGYRPAWFDVFLDGGTRMRALFSRDFLAEIEHVDAVSRLLCGLDVRNQLTGRPRVNQSTYLWSKTVMANYIHTVEGDHVEMASAVETRVPFLDHRLVELAVQIPPVMKIRGGIEKYVLREAARPVVIDAVYRRPKQPFFAPPIETGNGVSRDWVQDVLRSNDCRAVPFFDHAAVLALLDRLLVHPEEQPRWSATLSSLLSATYFHRLFRL
jgi:asparagine synthase (glutamine-hydrolysing)